MKTLSLEEIKQYGISYNFLLTLHKILPSIKKVYASENSHIKEFSNIYIDTDLTCSELDDVEMFLLDEVCYGDTLCHLHTAEHIPTNIECYDVSAVLETDEDYDDYLTAIRSTLDLKTKLHFLNLYCTRFLPMSEAYTCEHDMIDELGVNPSLILALFTYDTAYTEKGPVAAYPYYKALLKHYKDDIRRISNKLNLGIAI